MKKIFLFGSSAVTLVGIAISLQPEVYQSQDKTLDSLDNFKTELEISDEITSDDIDEGSVFLVPPTDTVVLVDDTLYEYDEEEYVEEVVYEEEVYDEVVNEITSDNEIEEEKIEFDDLSGVYFIKSIESLKYLSYDESNLILKDEGYTWNFVLVKDNYYNIKFNDDLLFINGDFLELGKLDDSDTSLWKITSLVEGIMISNDNKCLEVSNDKIVISDCNMDNKNQIFLLDNNSKILNGSYRIRSYNSEEYLGVKDGSKKNDAKIILDKENNLKDQVWYFDNIEDDSYSITSGMNINMGISTNSKNNLVIKSYQEIENQKWIIYFNDDGSVYIKNSDNYCFTKDENMSIKVCKDLDSQKFILEEYSNKLSYYGIDISYYQEDIDFKKLSDSEVEFVIIRAGYGDNWTSQDDSKLIDNVKGCEEYDIPYGIYLYSYAKRVNGSSELGVDSESVSSEVSHILRLLDDLSKMGYEPNLKTEVFYDMEDDSVTYLGKSTLTNMADEFCSRVEESGYRCGIYANSNWLVNYLDISYLKGKYDLWLAEWPMVSSYEEVKDIKPNYSLTDYDIWQFSSTGVVSGISAEVDLDIGYNIFS